MLTPGLEKLILEGRAEYIQFTVGGGAVGTIPVPQRNHIVLTDIIWTPFLDTSLYQASDDPITVQNRTVKQLQLRSLGKNVNWIFRDQFLFSYPDPGLVPVPHVSVKLDPPCQYHCFHKFTEDVRVDIIVVPSVPNWVLDQYGVMPDISGEDAVPNGYGTLSSAGPLNTLKTFSLIAGGSFINVPGNKRNPQAAINARYVDQFHTDYAAGQELNNPTTLADQQNSSYPIVTFGYVQISDVSDQ